TQHPEPLGRRDVQRLPRQADAARDHGGRAERADLAAALLYLLHAWIPLVGKTEASVRFPSVVFGVLAVALLYILVRRILGPRVATIAALLAALSPFWIYYAQETRVYAQVTSLLVLALYLLVRATDETNPGPSRRF